MEKRIFIEATFDTDDFPGDGLVEKYGPPDVTEHLLEAGLFDIEVSVEQE